MRQVDHRIKRRRNERIRALQNRHYTPRADDPRNFPSSAAAARGFSAERRQFSLLERQQKRRTRLAMQSMLALMLFVFTFIVFQSNTPVARDTQGFITEVMQRDFNFQGVADWYEANLGSIPVIIPTFTKSSEPNQTDDLTTTFVLPTHGSIIEHYSEERPYISLTQPDEGQVTAGAEGLVSFIGEKDGWGNCIVLQHAGDMETWYGPFSTVDVELSDWVQPEEVLGLADPTGEQLQFAVKQGGQFVDPLDVIGVD